MGIFYLKKIPKKVLCSFAQKSTCGPNIVREINNNYKILSIISHEYRPPDGLRKLPALRDTVIMVISNRPINSMMWRSSRGETGLDFFLQS